MKTYGKLKGPHPKTLADLIWKVYYWPGKRLEIVEVVVVSKLPVWPLISVH